jgi:hypothetical protein
MLAERALHAPAPTTESHLGGGPAVALDQVIDMVVVFFDITIGGTAAGRLEFELYADGAQIS